MAPMSVNLAEAERIRAAYAANPRKMTVQLARELNVPEVHVVRALPEGLARELDAVTLGGADPGRSNRSERFT